MKCRWCGAEFIPDHGRLYCSKNCARLKQIDNVKRYQAKHPPKDYHTEPPVVILQDPDPEAAFKAGAEISRCSLKCGLEMGTFTPGTVFLDGAQTYRVEGYPGYAQRKVRV
jgi:hypothetical protein